MIILVIVLVLTKIHRKKMLQIALILLVVLLVINYKIYLKDILIFIDQIIFALKWIFIIKLEDRLESLENLQKKHQRFHYGKIMNFIIVYDPQIVKK